MCIRDRLKDGGIAGIYPEGTRSVDGRLYKGKTGVARLALAANVPVVPCAITHNEITGKLFGAIPMADHPVVTFGRPLDFSRYAGCQDDRAVIRWVTDEIMNAIMELSGQTYVDAYGTSIKYGGMTVEEADARVAARPGLGLAVPEPVSYTHLDVYKRQALPFPAVPMASSMRPVTSSSVSS